MSDNKLSTIIIVGVGVLAVGVLLVYMSAKRNNEIQVIKQQLQNKKLQEITLELQIIKYQLEHSRIIQKLQESKLEPKISPVISDTLYKNKESWEFVRNDKNYISKVDVIRDVKSNK